MSRVHRTSALVFVLLAALVAGGVVFAWVQIEPNGLGGYPSGPFIVEGGDLTFHLEQDGSSQLDDGSDLEAIQNSFSTISGIPTSVAVVFEGSVFDLPSPIDVLDSISYTDEENRIYFFETDTEDVFGEGAVAAAVIFFDVSTNTIFGCDIVLSDLAGTWSTATPADPNQNIGPDTFDVEEVANHEIMHCFGFEHGPIAGQFDPATGLQVDGYHSGDFSLQSTLFPIVTGTVQGRTLEPDDIAAFSAVYPSSTAETAFGEISGRVILPRSTGRKGVHVVAVRESEPHVPVTGSLSGVRFGKPSGWYHITGLSPGNYLLRIEPMLGTTNAFTEFFADLREFFTDFPPEFYSVDETAFDLEISPDDSQVLRVEAGTVLHGVDFTLNRPTPRPPSNDSYDRPYGFSDFPFSYWIDTSDATTQEEDPTPSCGGGTRNKSVWYRFTVPGNTTVLADTLGSNYDTVLSAWTFADGVFTEIACNDNAVEELSQVSFSAEIYKGYFLMISSAKEEGGILQMNVTLDAPIVKVSLNSLPFEDVAVGARSKSQRILLKNVGSRSLVITDFVLGSSQWEFSEDCGDIVEPGGLCYLKFTFVPTVVNRSSGSLWIYHNDLESVHQVYFSGRGLSPFEISVTPAEVVILDVTNTATFTVAASSSVDFADPIRIDCYPTNFHSCSSEPSAIFAGQSAVVTVTLNEERARSEERIYIRGISGAFLVQKEVYVFVSGFDFSVSPSSQSIEAGQTAAFDFRAAGYGIFSGYVSLSCAGAPENSTCTFIPSGGTTDKNTAVEGKISIQTRGSSAIPAKPKGPSLLTPTILLWWGVVGVFLCFIESTRRRKPKLGLAAACFFVFLWASCNEGTSNFGPSSSAPPTPLPPTPAGTYELTITGTSPGLTRTATVTLEVK